MSDPHPAVDRDFIPIAEAAARSGFSRASLYRYASLGELQLVRRGGKTGVEPWELERFVRKATTPFVPGERIINNAGGHLKTDPSAQAVKDRRSDPR